MESAFHRYNRNTAGLNRLASRISRFRHTGNGIVLTRAAMSTAKDSKYMESPRIVTL